MPTNTPDQQIPEPVDADSADNPVAFNQSMAVVEPRLVRQYTTEADRTTRMTALNNGSLSALTAPTTGPVRSEVYNGTNHISLHARSLYTFLRKTADETVNNTATLQNDDVFFVAVPTAGVFVFDLTLFYTSNNTADIKFAFTHPAGAVVRWGTAGLASSATATSGDSQYAAAVGSGSTVLIGGGNATTVMMFISGILEMGGTAGTFQLQWAQNTADASNTTVNTYSNMRMWRVA